MKSTLILLAAVLVLTGVAAAQAKQPRTVRDFFMALPERYFSLDCCMNLPPARRKAEYLKRYLNVEDTANGYISAYGDAAQEGFAMALFRRPNGSYLIGLYTYGEGGVEDTPSTVFLDYDRGRWRDVSATVVTGYSKEKFIYELPRVGTTVEVFAKDENSQDWYKGRKLRDLVWDGRKFTARK